MAELTDGRQMTNTVLPITPIPVMTSRLLTTVLLTVPGILMVVQYVLINSPLTGLMVFISSSILRALLNLLFFKLRTLLQPEYLLTVVIPFYLFSLRWCGT